MGANEAWVLVTLIVVAGCTVTSVAKAFMSPFACPAPASDDDDLDEELDQEEPVDMILYCPECHAQHVDEPDADTGWDNPPHKSHLCHECKTIWRPADVPTNGVAEIRTRGERDTV